jgi:type II secretion system protein D
LTIIATVSIIPEALRAKDTTVALHRWRNTPLLRLLVLITIATPVPPLLAQQAITSSRLPVRHASMASAAATLQQAIREQRLPAEVLVDSFEKELVIRADAATQQKVKALWGNLDRPAAKTQVLLVSGEQPRTPAEATVAPAVFKAPLSEKRYAVAQTQMEVESNTRVLEHVSPQDLQRALLATWSRLSFEQDGSDTLTARLPGTERATLSIDYRSRTVKLAGAETAVAPWRKVLAALDAKAAGDQSQPLLLPLQQADPAKVLEAVQLLGKAQPVAFQQPRQLQLLAQNEPAAKPADAPATPADHENSEGPIGPVTIEILDGLDVIVVRGKKRDVERVQKIIADIERQSLQTTPEIEIFPLKHIEDRAVSELVGTIYDQVFGPRQSRVSITPLSKPNALLLIGRKENVAAVKELIGKLDQPVSPQSQLKVYPLKHAAAIDVEKTVRNFFVERPGFGTDERLALGTRVNVIADYRINALIVQASPRDLVEVAALIKRIDVAESGTSNEVRIFRLKNALAEELAPVLQEAITGQRTGAAAATTGGGGGTTTSATASRPNSMLQLMQLDGSGRKTLESGILATVKVVADTRGNALVITGPAQGMELISLLVQQLDSLPGAEAQIKVFTLVNGEAQTIVTALQQLFGQAGGQGNQLGLQTATGGGDSTLVPLRFTVDQRTNSVIASGSGGDLEVVERLLIRLDEGDVRRRKTVVYRLRNAPATDVSLAINQFLQNQRQVNQLAPTQVSQSELIEREVVVVPERVSNSLLVSATPRYFEEIQKIVEDLDKRPPMVVIQVLIAEVTLDNLDEFGVELGLQDALLFNRGLGNGANGTNAVGFPFNNSPLGNNSDARSLATANNVAGQGLSHFSLGRTNSGLGHGGLVLSASSESVNILLRALQRAHQLQVVSRPQVQTLDNQPAFVQVGARVPRITTSTPNSIGGVTNGTELINVGILLGVTPRTSPDGLIVMEINAEKSEVGPEATGIPISVTTDGSVIRSPQIFITTAQTTVSARSGQTVILGGLITKSRDVETRRVPYLSDVPVLGRLFRYDAKIEKKTELLIVMTPYVMRTDEDIEAINAREAERMNWCLADVADVHGIIPGANGMVKSVSTQTIFPDANPTGEMTPLAPATEALPSPSAPPRNPTPLLPRPGESAVPLEQPGIPSEPLPGTPMTSLNAPQNARPGLQAAAMESASVPSPVYTR